MFYGDLHLMDILIFAGVAAFLFYRLRGVLGKRTGFEKKNNVDQLRNLTNKNQAPEEKHKKPAIILDKNIKELEKAYEILPNFDHANFLKGARNAFEVIVGMFNQNNKEGLKKLVSKEVYKKFSDAIDSEKTPPNNQILSLEIKLINKVWVKGKKIFITITYLSKQIDSTGSNETPKTDEWTFEKNISSNNPAWILSFT